MSRLPIDVVIAAIGTAAVLAVYLMVIDSQGGSGLHSSRVVFVAVSLGPAATTALAAGFLKPSLTQLALLGGAAFLLLLWTILGAFSIGILLLVPTVLVLRRAGLTVGELASARAAWIVLLAAATVDLGIVAAGLTQTG